MYSMSGDYNSVRDYTRLKLIPGGVMFFELSQVLGFFLVPSNIMVILGLAGVTLLAIGYARVGRSMLVAATSPRFSRENHLTRNLQIAFLRLTFLRQSAERLQ